MPKNGTFVKARAEIQRGMRLSKCRKCGCMKGTLENLKVSLPNLNMKEAQSLLGDVDTWLSRLEPLEYPCFGCSYCIPPEAMTLLITAYPELASSTLSGCEFTVSEDSWPVVEGEYFVMDRSAPVAISTLASTLLAEKLSASSSPGLSLVGKTETENIGIDKVIKNIICNPAIRYLVLAGKDASGHQSGQTLLALWENGVDSSMRVVGSRGRRPILKNVTLQEIDRFRQQVQVEDMIGCENTRTISKKVRELATTSPAPADSGCGCEGSCEQPPTVLSAPLSLSAVPKVAAKKFSKTSIKLDPAGYFVIIPSKKKKTILVEHYSYQNRLLRTIEGKSGRDIYLTIISNNWIQDLNHAAYLGKELARAELSLQKGFPFVQDGA